MKIIRAGFNILNKVDGQKVLRRIEAIARTCYKSEEKISENSASIIVGNLIKQGHEAMLEHVSLTIRFIVDRGISHELVRHRLASYAQESTRYCNYGAEKFGREITVIAPCFWDTNSSAYNRWKTACEDAENWYFNMLKNGATPEQARTILPHSLKTEVIMTANLREWRHFFKLRTDEHAHPQMREVAVPMLITLQSMIPVVFDDIEVKREYIEA